MAFTLGVAFATEAVELNAIEALTKPRGLANTKPNAQLVVRQFINRERRALAEATIDAEAATKKGELAPPEGVT